MTDVCVDTEEPAEIGDERPVDSGGWFLTPRWWMARRQAASREVGSRKLSLARLRRLRSVALAGVDALSWFIAAVTVGLILDSVPGGLGGPDLYLTALLLAGAHVATGAMVGMYNGRFRIASFGEGPVVGFVVAFVAMVAVGVDLAAGEPVPVGMLVLAAPLMLTFACVPRALWRALGERALRPSETNARRTLVYSSDATAVWVVSSLLLNPYASYVPVALLDDYEPNRRIMGVKRLGGRGDIRRVADEVGATDVLIALPHEDEGLLAQLGAECIEAGLRVHRLPASTDLIGSPINERDIRPLSEGELLGRTEIETDLAAISDYLGGRTVLVTGAGGSIGSELCRRIHSFGPARLLMLDRDESALHSVQLSIFGRALLHGDDLVVADLRDRRRIFEVMDEYRPDVVFHAAALKHLSLLERFPGEAYATNVLGTVNVLDAAMNSGVSSLVNVSTDKAADPSSVLGATKRIGERLAAACRAPNRRFVSVRFGNVLGSRGSMLETFRAQANNGGPITVTHRDVTRFFMTIPEAVQLVIQSGAIGEAGSTMVLDMGEPVRIADIARRIAHNAPEPIEIEYTGLRPGEKLHEVLVDRTEQIEPTAHPSITSTSVDALLVDYDDLAVISAGPVSRQTIFELVDAPLRLPDGDAKPVFRSA